MKRKDLSENQKRRDSRDFHHTARIHVADVCQAILSSIEDPSLGYISIFFLLWNYILVALLGNFSLVFTRNTFSRKIYNVVDDDPAPRAEAFAFARDLISERYPEMGGDLNHVNLGDAQRIIGKKLVSNVRMKKELGVELIYPSYKSGLKSIFDSW